MTTDGSINGVANVTKDSNGLARTDLKQQMSNQLSDDQSDPPDDVYINDYRDAGSLTHNILLQKRPCWA
jgi:hypothetical protein